MNKTSIERHDKIVEIAYKVWLLYFEKDSKRGCLKQYGIDTCEKRGIYYRLRQKGIVPKSFSLTAGQSTWVQHSGEVMTCSLNAIKLLSIKNNVSNKTQRLQELENLLRDIRSDIFKQQKHNYIPQHIITSIYSIIRISDDEEKIWQTLKDKVRVLKEYL